MSTTPTNDGGPAYPSGEHFVKTDPVNGPVTHKKGPLHKGMSLRDYFAAKALQGACANPNYLGTPTQEMAEVSYMLADLMLAARNQTTT